MFFFFFFFKNYSAAPAESETMWHIYPLKIKGGIYISGEGRSHFFFNSILFAGPPAVAVVRCCRGEVEWSCRGEVELWCSTLWSPFPRFLTLRFLIDSVVFFS